MMKHNLKLATLCLALLLALTGCQLAKEDGAEQAVPDKLAGVFITFGYLDLVEENDFTVDSTSSLPAAIDLMGSLRPEGRLYAELKASTFTVDETGETHTTHDYVFPIEGSALFTAIVPEEGERESYFHTSLSGALCDSTTNLSGGDGTSVSMEATLYVSKTAGRKVFYFNPVYQSADGRVYLVPGSGMTSVNNDDGLSSMSQTMTDTSTGTENGVTKTDKRSYKITVNTMYAPRRIAVLQMDADSQLLARDEYAADVMPEKFMLKEETAYLVVETHSEGMREEKHISREIYARDVGYFNTFYEKADGLCWPSSTEIVQGQ